MADIDRATKLAELEKTANNISFEDLGDRLGIFDKLGNLLRTEPKGKLASLSSGTSDSGW